MTANQYGSIILGVLGLGVAALSVWLHINNKDGFGWGFVAFCLIVTSCDRAST